VSGAVQCGTTRGEIRCAPRVQRDRREEETAAGARHGSTAQHGMGRAINGMGWGKRYGVGRGGIARFGAVHGEEIRSRVHGKERERQSQDVTEGDREEGGGGGGGGGGGEEPVGWACGMPASWQEFRVSAVLYIARNLSEFSGLDTRDKRKRCAVGGMSEHCCSRETHVLSPISVAMIMATLCTNAGQNPFEFMVPSPAAEAWSFWTEQKMRNKRERESRATDGSMFVLKPRSLDHGIREK